ncbi:YggS family pyridoxal phosphate-dependent enzyme [Pantoea sp. Nvir]|uniref:YggS family pyridoxal phosphate-dependent enzyme n=1 Tax=Pantoea sp. Nvir TaxID=2576760 RepID=UPI00135B5166|nr:YggS family pyridoxal phosphate-dependent enzyme [Pantoea sp. Nvir]MXP66760.1 YggS family pyridoxal phosphate-dependent enzyme [Pantoea sp. Nvir]CAJ0990912.1 Pyridoxal phosphate homeostasis protein [Pantoea sp. Nvir]
MSSIQHNLQKIRQRIYLAAKQCGRDPEEITLVAVSKSKPTGAIKEAIATGQLAFGENYVQEGVAKITALTTLPGIQWHFIGPLQANKSRLVAEHFNWCHTVDSQKIAQRLSDQRPIILPPLNVLIQINISNENSKSGIMLDALHILAQKVSELPRLHLRGLMAIPAPEDDYQLQLEACQMTTNTFHHLKQYYPEVDTLSLGMSKDMEAAITAGSTMLRIGTAVFGVRDYVSNTQ